MKIQTWGVYIVDDSFTEGVEICTTQDVQIFDISSNIQNVDIHVCEPNARVNIYAFHAESSLYHRHVQVIGEWAQVHVWCILAASNNVNIEAKVIGQLSSSSSSVYLHILSCAMEGGEIDLDGVVQIDEKIGKVSWKILEENIFLWESGKIRGIPSLLVRSNDVEAGHAARIERIPDEKLYYLRSRWIPKDDATVMMLKSAIATVFDPLRQTDEERHTELTESICSKMLLWDK